MWPESLRCQLKSLFAAGWKETCWVPANFLLALCIGDLLLFGHGNLQRIWQLAVATTKHCFVAHWVTNSSLSVPRSPTSHGCTSRQFRHAQVWTQGLRRELLGDRQCNIVPKHVFERPHGPSCLHVPPVPLWCAADTNNTFFLNKLKKNLFDCIGSSLWHVGSLVVACELSCSMWDLVPWPGTGPGPPALGAPS